MGVSIMKNFKQKFLVIVTTMMTIVGVTDASIAKNPAYAQSVDTKALASSKKLLSAVDTIHDVKTEEEIKKEAQAKIAKIKAQKAKAAEAAAKKAEVAKAKAAAYKRTYKKNGTNCYSFVAPESTGNLEATATYKAVQGASTYRGGRLTRSAGTKTGPNGKETFYNLNMGRVVSVMKSLGYKGHYWVRSDGVKMFGNYIILASNHNVRPRGTIYETSLGLGIVCDTGSFASANPRMTDIATAW